MPKLKEMEPQTKDKLHKFFVLFFTILANLVFLCATVYIIISKDYDLFTKLVWSIPVLAMVFSWDFAVLSSFWFTDWPEKIKDFIKGKKK